MVKIGFGEFIVKLFGPFHKYVNAFGALALKLAPWRSHTVIVGITATLGTGITLIGIKLDVVHDTVP
ncbi:MAG: hypothetical protein ACK50A_13890, partial [Sphingobacteriaceae bacterium]